MTTALPSCPQCHGLNVEPRGDVWWCFDCKQSFPLIAVEEPEPDDKKEKPE